MRIAADMSLQKRLEYFVSVLVLTVAMILVGVITNLFVDANYFHMSVKEGLAIDEERLGVISTETDISTDIEEADKTVNELLTKIKNLEGVQGVGDYSMDNLNALAELSFIGDFQDEIWSLDSDSENSGMGIRELNMNASLWDMLPLKLYEGKPPAEWENDGSTLIYLGYSFRDLVNVGDVFGKSDFKYRVSGIIEEGCAFLNSTALNQTQQNMSGSLVADQWMIEIMSGDVYLSNQSWFYITDKADRENLKKEIYEAAEEKGIKLRITWFDDVLEGIDRQNKIINSNLWDITLLLAITAAVLIITSQIVSILVRAYEYGIWYSCGATNKDMALILLYQNIRRMIFPLAAGAAANYLILYRMYYVLKTDRIMINRIFWTVEMPVMLLLAAGIIAICSFVPILIMTKKHPMEMLRGEV